MLRRPLPLLLSLIILLVLVAVPATRNIVLLQARSAFGWRHGDIEVVPIWDYQNALVGSRDAKPSAAYRDELERRGDLYEQMSSCMVGSPAGLDRARCLAQLAKAHPTEHWLAARAVGEYWRALVPTIAPWEAPAAAPSPVALQEGLAVAQWAHQQEPGNALPLEVSAALLAGMHQDSLAADALRQASAAPYRAVYSLQETRLAVRVGADKLPRFDAISRSWHYGMGLSSSGEDHLWRDWLKPYMQRLRDEGRGDEAWELQKAWLRLLWLQATNPESTATGLIEGISMESRALALGDPWRASGGSVIERIVAQLRHDMGRLREQALARGEAEFAAQIAAMESYQLAARPRLTEWMGRDYPGLLRSYRLNWVLATVLAVALWYLLAAAVVGGLSGFGRSSEPRGRRAVGVACGIAALVLVGAALGCRWALPPLDLDLKSPAASPGQLIMSLLLLTMVCPALLAAVHAATRRSSLSARLRAAAGMLWRVTAWMGLLLTVVYAGGLAWAFHAEEPVVQRMARRLSLGDLGLFWEETGIKPPEIHAPPDATPR